MDIKVKSKSVTFLEKNTGENLQNIGFTEKFLDLKNLFI